MRSRGSQLLLTMALQSRRADLATEQPQWNPVRQEQQPIKHKYAISFWNSRFTKSLLALFPFLSGLGTSLLLSRVKNVVNWQWTNVIPLLQTKTADTAHTGIFASVTRPSPQFLGGAWGRGYDQAPFLIFQVGPGDEATWLLYSACNHSVYIVCTRCFTLSKNVSVYSLFLMIHDYTQYTYFSVMGIFLVTDTPWSHATQIREVLLYTMMHCNILWHSVIYCDIVWYTVIYCGILWCTVVYCDILWYTVIYCGMLKCSAQHTLVNCRSPFWFLSMTSTVCPAFKLHSFFFTLS